MKDKLKFLVIALALAAVVLLAVILYPKLSEKVKQDEKTENTQAVVTTFESAAAEMTAGFTVYDADGNPVSIDDSLGKRPVIVNFWATWCPPCKAELPDFDEAYKKYGEDIDFYMVDLTDGARDTVESAGAFARDNGYTFPVYYDTEYDGAYTYYVSSIPVTLFIDKNGALLYRQVGLIDPESLDSWIAEILK